MTHAILTGVGVVLLAILYILALPVAAYYLNMWFRYWAM